MRFQLHKNNIRDGILFAENTKALVDETTGRIFGTVSSSKDFRLVKNTNRKTRYGRSIVFKNPNGKNFDAIYRALTSK